MRPALSASLRWGALSTVIVLIALWPTACSDSSGGSGPTLDPATAEAEREAFTVMATQAIGPTYAAFDTQVTSFVSALNDYADDSSNDTERANAQAQWRDVMSAWQKAEVFQLGPTAEQDMDRPKQKGLRDEIYSWPTTSPCNIDKATLDQEYLEDDFIETSLVNVRGLDALEYLLYQEDDAHACQSDSNFDSSAWSALDVQAVRQRRADYAKVLIKDIEQHSANLRIDWTTSGSDGFGSQLSSAGSGSEVYNSTQDALNDLFVALFYIELETKDMKLAEPAGLRSTCLSDSCPEKLEFQWSDFNREAIIANLEALEALLHGNNVVTEQKEGIYAILAGRGAESTAQALDTAVKEALSNANGIDKPLRELLSGDSNDIARVRELHDKVKAITDLLKSEFVTALNLSIPSEGAGDND